jgi:hypothetical protein
VASGTVAVIGHRSTRGLARATTSALALALAASAGIACDPHVDGNGVFREESWTDVGAFEGVAIERGIAATVAVGGQQAVRMSGDENVVGRVSHRVSEDPETHVQTLRVWVEESYTSFHPLRLTVTIPSLTLIRASGHTDETETSVEATGIQADTLTVSVADRAHVDVQGAGTGASSRLLATVADRSAAPDVSVELDAHLYPVADADVSLSAGARAWVKADDAVSGVAPAGTSIVNTGTGACLVQDGQGQPATCGQ